MGIVRTLLHVEASPRKVRSASLEVARSFVDALKTTSPGLAVDTMDLWSTALPEFDGAALAAKYAGLEGRTRTPDEERAWSEILTLADRLKRADLLLFSVPMWNWTIPYKLKHLIDLITQADVLFSFDEKGMSGLLHDKRAVCIYARGIDFTPGVGFPSTYDHQKPYMDTWLNAIGVSEVESIIVQKTLFGPELDRQGRDAASQAGRTLALRM